MRALQDLSTYFKVLNTSRAKGDPSLGSKFSIGQKGVLGGPNFEKNKNVNFIQKMYQISLRPSVW